MVRHLPFVAVVVLSLVFAAGGCQSCSSCHDYDPPVADCGCGCGCGRTGSAWGGCNGCCEGGCTTGGCSTCDGGCAPADGYYDEGGASTELVPQ